MQSISYPNAGEDYLDALEDALGYPDTAVPPAEYYGKMVLDVIEELEFEHGDIPVNELLDVLPLTVNQINAGLFWLAVNGFIQLDL